MIILNGIKLGLILAFLIGPVFFALLQTSIEKGFWSGVWMAIGVSLSDIIYVIICYLGLVQLFENPQFRIYMAYGGGTILVLFGAYYLFIKNRKRTELANKKIAKSKFYNHLLKGFVLNGMSPMVPIFWIGAISVANIDFGYQKGTEFFIFFMVVLITVLATDVMKAFLAGKLRDLVTPRFVKVTNTVVGIFLFFFGVRLLYLAETIAFF